MRTTGWVESNVRIGSNVMLGAKKLLCNAVDFTDVDVVEWCEHAGK